MYSVLAAYRLVNGTGADQLAQTVDGHLALFLH